MFRAKLSLKLMSLILSGIVLMGSVGVSIDFHICQGKIKTFSFFGDAKTCSVLETKTVCHFSDKGEAFQRKKCCSNESVYGSVSMQTDLHSDLSNQEIVKNHIQHCVTNSHIIKVFLQPFSLWEITKPPGSKLKSSINIVYQTFLI